MTRPVKELYSMRADRHQFTTTPSKATRKSPFSVCGPIRLRAAVYAALLAAALTAGAWLPLPGSGAPATIGDARSIAPTQLDRSAVLRADWADELMDVLQELYDIITGNTSNDDDEGDEGADTKDTGGGDGDEGGDGGA
jgi:hypothetical protein